MDESEGDAGVDSIGSLHWQGHCNDGDQEEKYSFSVLTTEQIVQEMNECIDQTNAIMQLPRTTMRLLLNHFDWDKETLLNAYFDSDGNPEKVFKDARVINPTNITSPEGPASSLETSMNKKEYDCDICFEEEPSSMFAIECGHRFCVECWCHYLTTKIKNEGMGQTISCPGVNCQIPVSDSVVLEIVSDASVKLRYQQLITNSYVQKNRLVRWCPSVNCSKAIRVEYVDWKPVTCSCSHVFCFQCGNNWHYPVHCSFLEKWMKVRERYEPLTMSDDDTALLWMANYTKECPKCMVTIEKNGGCNYMKCLNKNCLFEFCWICLGQLKGLGHHHSCTRYHDDVAKATATAAKNKVKDYDDTLKRFKFCVSRYSAQQRSLKLESEFYAYMDQLNDQESVTWKETEFLKKAADVLFQCRRTLSYTYIFTFFLKQSNQAMIIENNQRDLDTVTEILSEFLERNITSENWDHIKEHVRIKSLYCEDRRKVLLDHIREGYDRKFWEYIEEDWL